MKFPNDLIIRKDVIDILNWWIEAYPEYASYFRGVIEDVEHLEGGSGRMTIDKAIELIVSCVEAAESEYGTGEGWHKEWEAVEMASDALRQPKVIYCKDCKYYHETYCEKWSRYGTIRTKETGYCYRAKRRKG